MAVLAMKSMQYNPYLMAKLPKFLHIIWNWGRGTWRWRQILDGKWKYDRFMQAQWKIYNITVIMGTVQSLQTWLWSRYHIPRNIFLVST